MAGSIRRSKLAWEEWLSMLIYGGPGFNTGPAKGRSETHIFSPAMHTVPRKRATRWGSAAESHHTDLAEVSWTAGSSTRCGSRQVLHFAGPAKARLRTFPIITREGRVFVSVPKNSPSAKKKAPHRQTVRSFNTCPRVWVSAPRAAGLELCGSLRPLWPRLHAAFPRNG